MDNLKQRDQHRLVAMPYPGRGHINSMINLCNSILTSSNKGSDIMITFVLTEEWLSFIASDASDLNPSIRLASVPNVVPSEHSRAADMVGFFDAVLTKLEAPFERVLDHLDPPATAIVADTFLLSWVMDVGDRRSLTVAGLWPMAASVFSTVCHLDALRHNSVDFSEGGGTESEERAECVRAGAPPLRVSDLPAAAKSNNPHLQSRVLKVFARARDAHHLLLSSVYDLEAPIIDALRSSLSVPLHVVGPLIPYSKLRDHNLSFITTPNKQNVGGEDDDDELDHVMKWLDAQPEKSVLYVSFGSFLSISREQIEEISAGLSNSGVRHLWVARGEALRLKNDHGGSHDGTGIVVKWCDQLRTLNHSSVGGFWTHCGWNSTMEAIFVGMPLLTFPIGMDQHANSKLIVEDWKIGQRLKNKDFVNREEISEIVTRFMDMESDERKEMTARAKELQGICRQAISGGGSSQRDLESFIEEVLRRDIVH